MHREQNIIKLGLPKGRMEKDVFSLLADAGIRVFSDERTYRPSLSLPGFEAKILKPQNILKMLEAGSRDIGFAGADWKEELRAEVVELIDTGLNPVQVVAAAPKELLDNGKLPKRRLVVATEYERLAQDWIERFNLDASIIRSYGATEVFPPEDADCIVDNTATGSTLRANNLHIVASVFSSSTRLFANPKVLENSAKREKIEALVLLLRSVLDARSRVMLEVNVTADRLEDLVAVLPCMREPTIAPLHGNAGYALKAAVPKEDVPTLIPVIRERGGTDIVVYSLSQIVP